MGGRITYRKFEVLKLNNLEKIAESNSVVVVVVGRESVLEVNTYLYIIIILMISGRLAMSATLSQPLRVILGGQRAKRGGTLAPSGERRALPRTRCALRAHRVLGRARLQTASRAARSEKIVKNGQTWKQLFL